MNQSEINRIAAFGDCVLSGYSDEVRRAFEAALVEARKTTSVVDMDLDGMLDQVLSATKQGRVQLAGFGALPPRRCDSE